jgi:hypothetical protein
VRLRKIFTNTPLLLLLVGTLLTILSALISHIWISKNMEKIAEHQEEITSIEDLISQQWQRKLVLDQKEDMLSLFEGLAAQQITQSKEYTHVVKEFSFHTLKFLGNTDVNEIQKLIASAEYFDDLPLRSLHELFQGTKEKWIEDINRKYGELLEHEAESAALKKENNNYGNLALFFQIFGLLLVLVSRGHHHSGHLEE